MHIAGRAPRMLGDDRARELAIAARGCVLGIGQRQPHEPLLATEGPLEEPPRLLVAASEIGDERPMIAEIELRPVGLLEAVELRQGAIDITPGVARPGAGERARHLADQTDRRALKQVASVGEFGALRCVHAEYEAGDPMGGVRREQPAREVDRFVDLPLGEIHNQRLLEERLVRRVPRKRSLEEVRRRFRIVQAARDATREVAAKGWPDFGLALVAARAGGLAERKGHKGGDQRGSRKWHLVSPQGRTSRSARA